MKSSQRIQTLKPLYPLGVAAILTALCAIALIAMGAQAATYNTYFNNVEQGPGSTAQPSLTINGAKTADPQAPVSVESSGAQPVTPAPAPLEADTRTAASDGSTRVRPIRVGLSALFNDVRERDQRAVQGALVTATGFVLRDLGVTALGGVTTNGKGFYGGEFEFVPVRAGLFGLNNLVEVSGKLGASSLGSGRSVSDAGLWGTVHAGAGVSVNLGSQYAATANVRTNITGRDQYRFTMFDVGLQFRF